MKKNRPGVLLSTLVTADSVTEIEDYLLLLQVHLVLESVRSTERY